MLKINRKQPIFLGSYVRLSNSMRFCAESRMRNILSVLFTAVCLWGGSAWAASVELGRGEGGPGDLVTLILNIDDVPLDAGGIFSLGLELSFDRTKIRFVEGSETRRGVFQHENGGPADFTDLKVLPISDGYSIALGASYTDINFLPNPPGGGELISLDFLIAADAGNGDIPINIELKSSVENQVASATGGTIGVAPAPVPVPPALVLLGLPLALLLSKRKAV